mmetsp:Transcript_127025/g.230637  ORF Transcript_127025/g.230637 Transcript_127025/m.230637 type:complete len:240 (-) Transcript_127025:2348-3067(-)
MWKADQNRCPLSCHGLFHLIPMQECNASLKPMFAFHSIAIFRLVEDQKQWMFKLWDGFHRLAENDVEDRIVCIHKDLANRSDVMRSGRSVERQGPYPELVRSRVNCLVELQNDWRGILCMHHLGHLAFQVWSGIDDLDAEGKFCILLTNNLRSTIKPHFVLTRPIHEHTRLDDESHREASMRNRFSPLIFPGHARYIEDQPGAFSINGGAKLEPLTINELLYLNPSGPFLFRNPIVERW